jgi:hypothetical protein
MPFATDKRRQRMKRTFLLMVMLLAGTWHAMPLHAETLATEDWTTTNFTGIAHQSDTSNPHTVTLEQARTANSAMSGDFETTGKFGLGLTGSTRDINTYSKVYLVDNGASYLESTVYANTATVSPGLLFGKSRGDYNTPTAVQLDNRIGFFVARGYDGTAFQNPVGITFKVDGSVTSGSVPGRIIFETGVSTATRQERLQIKYDGAIIIPNYTATVVPLTVKGAALQSAAILQTIDSTEVVHNELYVAPASGTKTNVFNEQGHAELDFRVKADSYDALFVDSSTNTISLMDAITITGGGDITMDPAGNDILPSSNYDLNLGSLPKKYLTLHAAELWVETLVAQDTMATIGGRILVGPTTTLTSDLAAGGTTIYTKHNNLASGDRVYMEAAGKVEFMAVTSAAGGTGPYSYTVTRNLDGSGANTWYAGDAVFNTGTTGDGFIDLYSVRGVKEATDYGPTIVGNVRNSATYNDWTEHWAIGNLNGLYGYGSDTYGIGLGKYSGADYMTVDPTNGIRFMDSGDAVRAQMSSSTWTLGSTTTEHVNISSTAVQIKDGASVYTDLTAGALTLGLSTAEHVTVDSSGVSLYDNATMYGRFAATTTLGVTTEEHLSLTSSGIQFKNSATVNGSLAANVWTIGQTAAEHVIINTSGIAIKDGATQLASYGASTIIGQTGVGQANMYLTGGALKLRNNTTDLITLDGSTATITAATYKTATTGKRIEVNPSSDNEIHFYGDRGDTTVEQLATIGLRADGGDVAIGYFGNDSAGNTRQALIAQSDTGIAVKAATTRGVVLNLNQTTFTANTSNHLMTIWRGTTGATETYSSSGDIIHVEDNYFNSGNFLKYRKERLTTVYDRITINDEGDMTIEKEAGNTDSAIVSLKHNYASTGKTYSIASRYTGDFGIYDATLGKDIFKAKGGHAMVAAPTTYPDDADMPISSAAFYITEATNKINVKVRESDGSVWYATLNP